MTGFESWMVKATRFWSWMAKIKLGQELDGQKWTLPYLQRPHLSFFSFCEVRHNRMLEFTGDVKGAVATKESENEESGIEIQRCPD